MTASTIDGKAIAADIDSRARAASQILARIAGRKPGLAVVLIGDDPASDVYVRNKGRRAEAADMRSLEIRKPATTTEAEVIAIVRRLNDDPSVDGILVQMPLPDHIDAGRVIASIDPDKDVDGLTPVSAGRLLLGQAGLRPCTPAGCVMLAERTLGKLDGLSVVVIGRSILVGKPAALLFLEKNCTVTIAHSRTRDLPELCRTADILIAAVGRPAFVKPDWIKPGACVIDVGINRIPAPEKGEGGTRLAGDVDPAAAETAGSMTPVPGGVGPMTIALLLRNTVQAMAMREGVDLPALPVKTASL